MNVWLYACPAFDGGACYKAWIFLIVFVGHFSFTHTINNSYSYFTNITINDFTYEMSDFSTLILAAENLQEARNRIASFLLFWDE